MSAEVAILRAEVALLRDRLAGLERVAELFFEAGRADALCLPPRMAQIPTARGDLPPRHLRMVKP